MWVGNRVHLDRRLTCSPQRIPHIFLNSSSYDAARHWIPCVDNLWERCTWEMDVIVPRFLEMEAASLDDNGGSDYQGSDQAADDRVDAQRDTREGSSSGQVRRRDEDAERLVVVASGELEEQVRGVATAVLRPR